MCACMYARASEHQDTRPRPAHNNNGHTTGTQDTRGREETTGKERNTGKAEKPEYICMIAGTEKKV